MEIDRTSHSYLLGVAEARLIVLKNENEYLRAALQKIITEADDITALDSADIARAALKYA